MSYKIKDLKKHESKWNDKFDHGYAFHENLEKNKEALLLTRGLA